MERSGHLSCGRRVYGVLQRLVLIVYLEGRDLTSFLQLVLFMSTGVASSLGANVFNGSTL